MNTGYEVHQIKMFFQSWVNYSYIVIDKRTKAALVVDPAWELNKITDKLFQLNADLKVILLTHSHYDHVNLINPLIDLFNPVVYMSRKEIDYYNFRCRNLNALRDKEGINIGDTNVSCLLTQGHTAGGICYLIEDSLFTGDTIFTEGCGLCSEYGGSAINMFESIQKVKLVVPPHVHIYPGHSYGKAPGQTLEYLMKENIYFQINNKENFVNFRMRKNQKGIFDFR